MFPRPHAGNRAADIPLVQQIPLAQRGLALPLGAGLLRAYNAQHRQSLNAILYRQGTRTEFLMREHVGQTFDEVRSKSELLTAQSSRVSGER